MQLPQADFIEVLLDPSIHRVIRIGEDLSRTGPSAVLTHEDGTDFMSIATTNGTKKIKCAGTHVPPDTGHHRTIDPHIQHSTLLKDFHRIILLGVNFSGDPNSQLIMTSRPVPGSASHKDVLTFKTTEGTLDIPADGSGDKIPPNTGE